MWKSCKTIWCAPQRSTRYVQRGYLSLQLQGHTLALFYYADQVYAVDNRCPHMGFPLDRGAVHDGILTCYWHYARFDVATGGAFDQWADDVRAFPVTVRDGDVWIDLTPRTDPVAHQRQRLRIGLERDLSLVIGKAVLVLLDDAPSGLEPFRVGLDFGVHYRDGGWGQGLTMHTCMMNLLPHLAPVDRAACALSRAFGGGARFCGPSTTLWRAASAR